MCQLHLQKCFAVWVQTHVHGTPRLLFTFYYYQLPMNEAKQVTSINALLSDIEELHRWLRAKVAHNEMLGMRTRRIRTAQSRRPFLSRDVLLSFRGR
jgi:hypothetical protein